MPNEKLRGKLQPSRLLPNLACILLIVFGASTLVWVGSLIWHDITVWGKDIASILFSSRKGEYMFPTLGIDMRVIHYFLMGLTLLLSGALAFLLIRIKASKPDRDHPLNIQEKGPSKCPYNFGYLKKLDKNTPIPRECLSCSRMLECRQPQDYKREEPMAKTLVKKEKAKALDEKTFPGCPHEFGYLASRPKNAPIPNECIACQRVGDCMVATVVKKEKTRALDEKTFSGCLHEFGYLASRPKNTPIPNECIICRRLGDCMVATVKTKEE